jgi:hypothetical protein
VATRAIFMFGESPLHIGRDAGVQGLISTLQNVDEVRHS